MSMSVVVSVVVSVVNSDQVGVAVVFRDVLRRVPVAVFVAVTELGSRHSYNGSKAQDLRIEIYDWKNVKQK